MTLPLWRSHPKHLLLSLADCQPLPFCHYNILNFRLTLVARFIVWINASRFHWSPPPFFCDFSNYLNLNFLKVAMICDYFHKTNHWWFCEAFISIFVQISLLLFAFFPIQFLMMLPSVVSTFFTSHIYHVWTKWHTSFVYYIYRWFLEMN